MVVLKEIHIDWKKYFAQWPNATYGSIDMGL
jgi:hypothetical protein